MKNSEYSIINLIIEQLLRNVNFGKLLESLDEKSWEKYFGFLAGVLEKRADIYVVRIIASLYSAVENNQAVFARFLVLVRGFLSSCYGLIEQGRINQESNTFTVHS